MGRYNIQDKRLTTDQYMKQSLLSEANTRRYLLYRSLGESQSRSALPKLPDYTVPNNLYHNLIYLSSVSKLETWLVGWFFRSLVAQSMFRLQNLAPSYVTNWSHDTSGQMNNVTKQRNLQQYYRGFPLITHTHTHTHKYCTWPQSLITTELCSISTYDLRYKARNSTVVTFVLFCCLCTISGEKIISTLQASDTDTTLQAIGRLQG